mgnify:FL=1
MSFAEAIVAQEARTQNGMRAFKSSLNANTDLFFKIGASRGKNIIGDFTAAYLENRDIALRIAQWSRDVRGGAGERQLYRDIMQHLARKDTDAALALMRKAPELGRWDDVLVLADTELRVQAFDAIAAALKSGDGLCAKWMPRKGNLAAALRAHLGMTPKQYRKTLVNLTKVVETQMCAKDWDNINFEHVPSLASARYKKAFYRNAEAAFKAYVDKLTRGEAKVNAAAVYPYDVLKGVTGHYVDPNMSKAELDHVTAQWNSLPNYVGDASILPLVDVSGSMFCPAGNNKNLTCMDVSISLGLYLADKNQGKFKDCFLTFSSEPELLNLKGNILDKVNQMKSSDWGMSTNLHAALDKILSVATQARVPVSEMPAMLLILSDMQFNQCVEHDARALDMIRRKYETAGYAMPRVVFWNLNAHDNVPVRFDEQGTALISGFSPSIMRAVLADVDSFTPESIMLQAVMIDRYAV